ncbi:YicC/YloC family endoribonuclease [Alcaligenes sp. SDU_A2]|uniref:YicC/YloC family endoribonuclease n=1 Tax=Alcaligenes sp. SDU_A2 TaxID=3136634 RepID=UPI00311D302E
MIRSMTAFGSAKAESEAGSISIEMRSVNNRFLDVSLRLPDELRFAENLLREQLAQGVQRGKLDVRVNFARAGLEQQRSLDMDAVLRAAQMLQTARAHIPDLPAPELHTLLSNQNGNASDMDPALWLPMIQQACEAALVDLRATREREGQRLAQVMQAISQDMAALVEQVHAHMPDILAEQQNKIATRLRDALQQASPDGFALISGAELSARIAQEASTFSLRIDVAEELARLRSHLSELQLILSGQVGDDKRKGARQGSTGKRLDFLFQEMNREANTLGSKAGSVDVTRASIDLKLLIEQLREQTQNIE